MLIADQTQIRFVYRGCRDGTTGSGAQMTFAEFNKLIGVTEKYALAERFGAS